MIVEFTGLTGAGKTAIAEQLFKLDSGGLLTLDGRPPGRTSLFGSQGGESKRLERYAAAFFVAAQAVLRRPRLTLALLAYALGAGRPFLERIRLMYGVLCMVHNCALEETGGRSSESLYVRSEGLVQATVAITVPGRVPSGPKISCMLRHVIQPRVQAVVWVRCPRQVAAARVASRSSAHSRFDRWPRADVMRNLAILERVLSFSMLCLRRSGVPVLEISSERTPVEVAGEVLTWLRQLSGNPT